MPRLQNTKCVIKRLAWLCILLVPLAVVAAPNPGPPAGARPHWAVMTARARTTPVSGQDALYEVTIKNAGHID
jgi:hypothetical protein